MVTVELEKYSYYDFEGSVKQLISKFVVIQQHIETSYVGYTNIRLCKKKYDYEDDFYLALVGDRPENENELQEKQYRLNSLKILRKQQYEKLRKEFEIYERTN